MTHPILQAAVGPRKAWEFWLTLDTADKLAHAAGLVAESPHRWRIIEA